MSHSTRALSDSQFLRTFRHRFSTARIRQAVAARRAPTRDRALPHWALLAALVAWFWMPTDKLPWVLRWLRPARAAHPSDPAVYQARGRLGWAPLRWLRRHVAGVLAHPDTDPTAFYRGHRLLALDGTTFTAPDTPDNARTFGYPRNQHRAGGYPLIRAVALCELGTRALIDWIARGYHRGENRLARRLLRRVPAGALVLLDRNFHAFDLWDVARSRGFELLIRVPNGPAFPVHEPLPDGSYRSWVRPGRGARAGAAPVPVRVIRYQWTDRAGAVHESRLLTSLLNPERDPAEQMVRLYHARWEQELALSEVKGQLSGRVTQVRATRCGRWRSWTDCCWATG